MPPGCRMYSYGQLLLCGWTGQALYAALFARKRAPERTAAKWPRGVVPWYRNVLAAVPRTKWKDVAAMLKALHAQEDRAAGENPVAIGFVEKGPVPVRLVG